MKAWAWPLPFEDWPDYPSEDWILDEDRALRDLMKGMVVSDHEAGGKTRHVEAWFGHPDIELREQKYPYVTIDLLNIQEGADRVERGHLILADPPAWWGLEPLKAWQIAYLLEMPTPIDLDYQVSTWARNPRHDRQILKQMITGGRAMIRGGLLYTADHKDRRLDYLGHIKRDVADEHGKRLFNNVFRMRVSSEVPWGVIKPGMDYGIGIVEKIEMKIDSMMGKISDTVIITSGEVMAWYPDDRKADVQTEWGTATGVYVLKSVVGEPIVGSTVIIMADPKVSDPFTVADYLIVVADIETLPQVVG
jgi:hypothetical protein